MSLVGRKLAKINTTRRRSQRRLPPDRVTPDDIAAQHHTCILPSSGVQTPRLRCDIVCFTRRLAREGHMPGTIGRRELIAALGGAADGRNRLSGAIRFIPRVGFLWHAGRREEESPYYEAVIEGFAKLGYLDGRNIIIEHRFAKPSELPADRRRGDRMM